MTRSLSSSELSRTIKAKRNKALERDEFRYPSAPRRSAAGVTSAPLKAEDPEIRRMIDEALARRNA